MNTQRSRDFVLKPLYSCVAVIGLLLVAVGWSSSAWAQPFSQVIVFGDSNVDSGYFKQLSSPGGSTAYNSYWPSAVADGAGAPTTNPGLLSSQVLAAFFGLTANPANTTGGTNYATSGAKDETANTSVNGGFTAAIATGQQIRNYLSAHGGVADSQALYLIWSGDNDVSYANGDTGTGPFPSDPTSYVQEAAEDLVGDILFLKQAGAKHIIIAGLAYDFPTGNDTDSVNKRALKLAYTQELFQNANQILGTGFAYEANTDQVRLAISANPSNYGFINIGTGAGQMACSQPSGVTTAWALLCSSNPAAPSTYSGSTPQTDLFADDQHLGTSGQRLMANYLFHLVVPATATHDFNTDGKSDILWQDTSGDVALWLMNGASILQSAGVGKVPTVWSVAGQRDFNDDGKADILWHDTSGDVAIWEMNGATILQSLGIGNANPSVWSIVGTGDFFGNGNGDILWRDTSGDVAIWEMNGASIIQSCGVGTAPTTWSIAGTGDFNGDGMTDILWHDTAGDVAIWEMNGCSILQSAGVGTANPGVWSIAGTGDFNGDGMSDILWRDTLGDVAVWEMNGATILQSLGVGTANPSVWSIAQTGDYYGTGMSDILWRDTSGDVAVWEMNGATIVQSAGIGTAPPVWSIQGAGAD